MSRLQRQVPIGVRDIMPEEASKKRDMENKICKVFQGWGYQEVITPTFEFLDVLKTGSDIQGDSIFKFLDRTGNILGLRPDMTTPIARLAATKLKEKSLPLKLFYFANGFSFADPQVGRQREFFQGGIEFLGSQNPEADGEVIAIAVESLKAAGLSRFQINLGQIDVFNGLMDELGLEKEEIEAIKGTISKKNFVGLEEKLIELKLNSSQRDKVMKIITLHGGREVLDQARALITNKKGQEALDSLASVYEILELYQVSDFVAIDLGLLRGFEYYTGVVFEGYAPGIGFPICGGGRYDKLVGQFGFECPATGFALGIDRTIIALEKQQDLYQADKSDYFIIYDPLARGLAINKARELRIDGCTVETEVIARSQKESMDYAKAKGFKQVIYIDASGSEQELK